MVDPVEWQKHYDQRLDNFGTRLANMETKLSGEMGEIRALLQGALKNQEGVFARMNKPVGPLMVGALAVAISIVGVLTTFINLSIAPIREEQVREAAADLRYRHSTDEVLTMLADNQAVIASDIAVLRESNRWLEKIEARDYDVLMHLNEQVRGHLLMNGDAHGGGHRE